MNVKEVKRPVSSVDFKDVEFGAVFYDKRDAVYCVKTGDFRVYGDDYNAMDLDDMSPKWYDGVDEVIPCQHQINVWY